MNSSALQFVQVIDENGEDVAFYDDIDLGITLKNFRQLLIKKLAYATLANATPTFDFTFKNAPISLTQENFRTNTASAKHHHHGKDVNANISLHNQPKPQVKNLVVILHYSTANVNYICDDSDLNKKNVIVDSKDAKKIVCAEIQIGAEPML